MNIRIKRTHDLASYPKFSYTTDSGFNLNLVELIDSKTLVFGDYKGMSNTCTVEFYNTGIVVEPDEGYYVDLVPRGSLSKTGHILANSVGVIDETYRGSIIVPLMKFGNYNNIELGQSYVQCIVRKRESVNIILVDDVSETERGGGNLGSTGKY